MSWDEGFSHRYDEWSAHMTADVAFDVDLARAVDGPLVELAIGNGRVAIPVAQATRQRVIGIDSPPAMLEEARARAVLRILTSAQRFSIQSRRQELLAEPPAGVEPATY